jgi:hypothetical protein
MIAIKNRPLEWFAFPKAGSIFSKEALAVLRKSSKGSNF